MLRCTTRGVARSGRSGSSSRAISATAVHSVWPIACAVVPIPEGTLRRAARRERVKLTDLVDDHPDAEHLLFAALVVLDDQLGAVRAVTEAFEDRELRARLHPPKQVRTTWRPSRRTARRTHQSPGRRAGASPAQGTGPGRAQACSRPSRGLASRHLQARAYRTRRGRRGGPERTPSPHPEPVSDDRTRCRSATGGTSEPAPRARHDRRDARWSAA